MPFNGAGVFTPSAADNPVVGGTLILATKFNNTINDIATGLSNAVTRDGQSPATANLPMGGFRHNNVSDGLTRASPNAQYASLGQVQDGGMWWAGTAGGTADAITLILNPAIPAYAAGQSFTYKSGGSPNTGAMTVAVSGLTTKAIQINGSALTANQHPANRWFRITYDGAAFQLEQLEAPGVGYLPLSGGTLTGALILSGAAVNTAQGADIASAATINLTTATGNYANITGTTNITAITLAQGYMRVVKFAGALTLTNSASLILPGGADIITAAGDTAIFVGEAASVVRCVLYVKAAYAPAVGAQPTRQVFTSGSGTYNRPTGATRLFVRVQGGGSGGAGSGTGGGASGAGGNSTFDTVAGNGGASSTQTTPGAGGTASNGSVNIAGGRGSGFTAAVNSGGGVGGNGMFGGAGGGGSGQAGLTPGLAAATNSGGGGGGGGTVGTANTGSGGSAGGYAEKWFIAPSATYAYAVGAGGTAGAAGTGGDVGGVGGSGVIIVDEFYD